MPTKKREFFYLVGVDEAGRGPLAGPLSAACVCLKKDILGLKDSKKLTPGKREDLFKQIEESALFSCSFVPEKVIDKINIYQATILAFRLAINKLFSRYKFLNSNNTFFAVDGNYVNLAMDINYFCLPQADSLVKAVSAASIVAKVLRDRVMRSYGQILPQWEFAQHKGYPTTLHRKLIKRYGLSPIHRLSFVAKKVYEPA